MFSKHSKHEPRKKKHELLNHNKSKHLKASKHNDEVSGKAQVFAEMIAKADNRDKMREEEVQVGRVKTIYI